MSVIIEINQLQQFKSLELIARQVVEGFITGMHKSPFHGFSVEFAEHRLYNNGESIKNIDWKLYGRTDRLFTKRYEEETNLRCQIIIDNSSSMYFPVYKEVNYFKPTKIMFSVYASAALLFLMKKQKDAVGLHVYNENLEVATPVRSGNIHHKNLMHELEKLLTSDNSASLKKTGIVNSLNLIAEKIHRRSLVVIFSDMFDSQKDQEEIFAALQHLRYNNHEVILFYITDKKLEEEFLYDNRPLRIKGMEEDDQIRLNPVDVREEFNHRMVEYRQNLMERCLQFKIDFVEADINNGFHQILVPYFAKRKKLH